MKSSTKSSIRNSLVTIILLGTAGFFGWMFWGELTRTVEITEGTVIGEVVEVRGQAQRRYDRQSRWGSLKGTDQVYNLDAIRTSEESGAVIVLRTTDNEGNEQFDDITLGPNTYIILDLTGDQRNINFVGGDLSASGSQGLTVTAEGTSVAIDEGAVNLSRIEGQETEVSVTDGEALVRTGAEETLIGTESILRINEGDGSTVREQAVLSPTAPGPNALLLTFGDSRIVNFGWELFADWTDTVLEVSLNPQFVENDAPIVRIPATDSAAMELPPGIWYWRVVEDGSANRGPVNVFTVDTERLSNPTAPVDDLVIPYRGTAPTVSLQWDKAWFADSYRLEVSRNASFSDVVENREVQGSSVLIESLEEGTWWWRIRPQYRRGILDRTPEYESRAFTLERRLGHDRVELISPTDQAILSALEVREGVNFRWKAQEALVDYRIEVASDENFTNMAAISDAPENWRMLLPAPESGTYHWRVFGTASDGQSVPVSETRSFSVGEITGSVELVDPAPGETKDLKPYEPHQFVWRSSVPGTARFQLERLSDSDGGGRSKIMESMIRGENFTAPLPGEGSYVWKVQILDDGGRMLVSSQEARFRIRSEFRAPVLAEPRPGSGVDLVGSDSILIAWDPAPGADAYAVSLEAPDGTVIGRDDRVSALERTFPIPAGAAIGEYSVSLTSLRNNPPAGSPGRSEPAVYSFRVNELVRYTAAVPTSPANGTVVGELEALRTGVTLRWTQNPSLGRWTVELDNGNLTRLYRTSNPELLLQGLEPGSYTWKIRSSDSLGQEAPESRTSGFTVSDLPIPSSPVVLQPAAGSVVDMTGAKDLVFSWQAVDNADFYDIALYDGDSGALVLRETGLTGTRYVLRNLRILDIGGFVLSVRARSEYSDVGAVRESPERRVPFSLTVNIADQAPTILTDELQYAE